MSKMTKGSVIEVFRKIFHEIAPEIDFTQIKTNQDLRDQIEIDSFDFYRIIVKIDKETGVNIPDSKIPDLPNLDSLIDYIVKNSI
jgi:acyl carrier protein